MHTHASLICIKETFISGIETSCLSHKMGKHYSKNYCKYKNITFTLLTQKYQKRWRNIFGKCEETRKTFLSICTKYFLSRVKIFFIFLPLYHWRQKRLYFTIDGYRIARFSYAYSLTQKLCFLSFYHFFLFPLNFISSFFWAFFQECSVFTVRAHLPD